VDYDNKLEFIFEIDSQQEIVYTFSYDELVFVVAEYSTEMCYLKNLEKTI
jgi:sensor domain CHASE-containing protein